ncbi:hypothetical protein ES708_34470 [subsurface metagenome]
MINTVQVLTGDIQSDPFMSAGSNENGIITLLEEEAHIINLGVQLYLHSHFLYYLDLPLNKLLSKPVSWNSHGNHSTSYRKQIKYRNLIPLPSKVISC